MSKDRLPVEQIAALPVHWDRNFKLRILMVTSRDSGRWVMPKGWRMDGKKPWRAAEIEALEEAGAVGHISKTPVGQYHYQKRLDNGRDIPCRVTLYPMVVEKLKRRWKERKQRKRHWFTPERAASLVDETELSELLGALAEKSKTIAMIEEMRKSA